MLMFRKKDVAERSTAVYHSKKCNTYTKVLYWIFPRNFLFIPPVFVGRFASTKGSRDKILSLVPSFRRLFKRTLASGTLTSALMLLNCCFLAEMSFHWHWASSWLPLLCMEPTWGLLLWNSPWALFLCSATGYHKCDSLSHLRYFHSQCACAHCHPLGNSYTLTHADP